MKILYEDAPDAEALVNEVIGAAGFKHILKERVFCVRSKGSKSKYIIARIHGLPKIWQRSLKIQSQYIIEVISENYDGLDIAEREKTLIHELLHIPKGFKGGFRHHKGWITRRKIEGLHTLLLEKRESKKKQYFLN